MVTTPLDIVRAVDDPELPHVTIGDLGMVRAVEVDGRAVRVRITPTFTGCPATEQIRSDVELALRSAGYEPTVEFVMAPAWSTDDISRAGRQKLQAAGIAPPSPSVGRPRGAFHRGGGGGTALETAAAGGGGGCGVNDVGVGGGWECRTCCNAGGGGH